jgi:hypothetical protein
VLDCVNSNLVQYLLQTDIQKRTEKIQWKIQTLHRDFSPENPNSLTENRKPSAKNHVPKKPPKYHVVPEICHPEKKISGALPTNPHARGSIPLHPPLTPLRARRRCSDTTTHAKNITHTQHSPTCCFLCTQGVTGLHSQQSKATMPMDPLHQEKFSVLTDFVNESATFFKVSTFINDTFFSSIMSLTK